jgi:retron-type reverse transcriptase
MDAARLVEALRAVVRNEGTPGVDGFNVNRPGILKARWSEIEDQLLQGRYQPQPVRRVRIPKPAGGTRNLGIPTVIDRLIQQAVLQRLQPRWDPTFSEHSASASGRAAPPTRRWRRRKPTSLKAIGLWWISTWRNSWTLLHNAPWFMK